MSVDIWITYNNNDEWIMLPVNPGELSIQNGSANETVSVQGLGEVSIIQNDVLTVYSFSSHFPKHYGPYCKYVEIPDPKAAVAVITKWRQSGQPCRFIVSNDHGMDINIAVTIETFDIKEQAGDVGSLYYDITLREYKYIQVRQVVEKKNAGETKTVIASKVGQRPNERPKPSSYTVKKGDSLYVIGRILNVDHMKIAQANNIKAPYTIYPNQVLVIP
ncbi:LysM peptidoglycan-binding domain-containing protein [Brevibacillus dissolubilis]|uniref:LysM peptidoglycan-binding domain-containing protein n=1 Tax=Brevibacillus dissolubilis TaxID=1844116 RepID=UPI00159BC258|nr:LysM peptidoglycan-binding domain-containing protein [Brevibacillus dissolubilis]